MKIFSTDHRIVAKEFLFSGLVALVFGGVLAMVIRWQWAYPGRPLPLWGYPLRPASYQAVFTLHGLVMIFFAITPILIGTFGTFTLPLLIGAREMAFPQLSRLSFWIFAVSLGLMLASMLTQLGTSGAGWTQFPPLSSNLGNPALGQTLTTLAILVNAFSSLLGSVNYVTTVIRERAPGMTFFRLPLTVWGIWLTAILNVMFLPLLCGATFILLVDRLFHTQFFAAGAMSAGLRGSGGDPILYQHLFWLFGHPEVYILILPVWGIVGDMMAFFSRKPAHWYRGTVGSMIAVTALSALVYGHHMFVTGLNPLLGKGFMLLTLLISVPAEILVLNWLATLWRGSTRLTSPMLFALGTLFVFGLGGLTGLYLGAVTTDIYLHDSLWVVGHFHLIMAAATFLGSFCAIYFWFPKMFGKQLNETLAKLHFGLTLPLLVIVFGGQLLAGYSGQQRRLYDPYEYDYIKPLLALNRITSHAAFTLGAVQLIFVWNFFFTLWKGPRAVANPWQVGTLDWTDDRQSIPQVLRGPHALSHPDTHAQRGRDWIGQAEK